MSAERGSEHWRDLEPELKRVTALDAADARSEALLGSVRRALAMMSELEEQLAEAHTEQLAHDKQLMHLRESEERWRSFVENPFDYVCIVDRDGLIQYLNRTDPSDIKMDDLLGRQTIYDYTSADSHADIRQALEQVFDQGRPAYYETYVELIDTWFGTVVGPIAREGEVRSASLLSRNITPQKNAEMRLQESEQRFRQLAEHIQDVFFLIDPHEQRTLYVSPAYESLWGRTTQHVYSHSCAWLDGIHPEDRPAVLEKHQGLLATCADPKRGGYSFGKPDEYRVLRPDGSVRWVRTRNFAIFDHAGNIFRVAGVATDITEHRGAQQRLAEAEAKYRILVEQLPVISYIAALDDARTTLYISPQVETKLGFPQDEWTADPELWQKRVHREDQARVMAEVRQFRRSGEPMNTIYRLLSRDGATLWFRDQAVLVHDETSGRRIVEGVMLDVSEAEEARAERQRARALASHLVEVQEAERRRIARELHDEIGQTLTGLKLMIQMVPQTPGNAAHLREVGDVVGSLMDQIRTLSMELRPSMLDDLGLLPTLLAMFDRFGSQTGMKVNFTHRNIKRRFDPDIETAAYRLVQEAVTNVARHAGVHEVEVRSWSDKEYLRLQVRDDGVGFDVGSVLADANRNGLCGIRERVAVLGGQLSMESKPGGGTRLTAQIPIQPEDGA